MSEDDKLRFARLRLASHDAQQVADAAHRRLRDFHKEMSEKYPEDYLAIQLVHPTTGATA